MEVRRQQMDVADELKDQSIHRPCPGLDIISDIPEMILFHILAFLPRKDAIRTGILSSKWKNLWKNRFSHKTILTFGRPDQNDELATKVQQEMSDHGKRKIEIFNLHFYPGIKHQKITSLWVEQAVLNGVEEFNLDFSEASTGFYERREKRFELQESLFQSNKLLAILSLSYCRLHRYFKFKYFRVLERLSLCEVNINDAMLGKLVSNCQLLKYLELKKCYLLKSISIPAKLHGLKKLIIADCHRCDSILISAPRLCSFQYYFGRCPDSFVLVMDAHMHLLSDAITFHRLSQDLLCMCLGNARVLTLSNSSLRCISEKAKRTWMRFGQLRELQLLIREISTTDLSNMYGFFMNCKLPHLQRLFIELPIIWPASPLSGQYIEQGDSPYWPSPTFQHLKLIKINNFRGYGNEKLLIRFFLSSCIKVERVVLVFPLEFDKFTRATERERLFRYLAQQKAIMASSTEIVWFYASQDDHSFQAAHSEVLK